jgi:hypothetical protein
MFTSVRFIVFEEPGHLRVKCQFNNPIGITFNFSGNEFQIAGHVQNKRIVCTQPFPPLQNTFMGSSITRSRIANPRQMIGVQKIERTGTRPSLSPKSLIRIAIR